VTDRVLIPFGPEILVLTAEEFAQARDRGREISPPREQYRAAATASQSLVRAETIAEQFNLAKSAVYEYAKAGRIPCVRVGRHVRFDVAAVRSALGGSPVGHR
jgi:excisionase family DNA binding protein